MTIRAESFLSSGSAAEAARSLVNDVRAAFGGKGPKLLFVFASTAQPLDELCPIVSDALHETLVLSASTAGEFTERGDHKGSVSAIAFDGDFVCSGGVGRGLALDVEGSIDRALSGQDLRVPGYEHQTAVLILDPLAGHAEEAALLLAMKLGDRARIAGGAAGDDLAMKRTLVGCNATVTHDAAVVALLHTKRPLAIGVRHGHRAHSEAFVITDADGSLVKSIEGKPAWPFWREAVRAAASRAGFDVDALQPAQAGPLLLRFEGALDAGSELKVRAPLAIEGESIRFACEIPVGSRLRITDSNADGQVLSAIDAARHARAQLGEDKVAGAVVFDCICRNLILADRFGDAVRGMAQALGATKLAGFETYGEIALTEGDLSGFHNTTSVVLAFGESDG
ncbi:MAG: FIST N-terminal domain-containing protein [Polyangiales bacterium]